MIIKKLDGSVDLGISNFWNDAYLRTENDCIHCQFFELDGGISIAVDENFNYIGTAYPGINYNTKLVKAEILRIKSEIDKCDEPESLPWLRNYAAELNDSLISIEKNIEAVDLVVNGFISDLGKLSRSQIECYLKSAFPHSY